jgi:predicted HTH domain antitoxin
MSDATAIAIRLDADIDMDIDRLAKAEHIPKSTMARKFIEGRLEQYRIEKAIELYVNEKRSLKDVSEITGVTVQMIMETLRKKNIPLRMGEEVFDRGMEHARRVFGV